MNQIPHHLAIIMDGNRRWAKKRGLNSFSGHKQGYETFKKIAKKCSGLGIKILKVYAFSTENWKRSKSEVFYLMNLLFNGLSKEINFFQENKIRFNAIGEIEKLPKKLRDLISRIMDCTKDNKNGILNLAINYGGRMEILNAAKKIIKDKINSEELDEKIFENYLFTAGQPDPDLIIRAGGETRLSGFLLWQSAYSELYFSDKLWPDFTENDLKKAIKKFQICQRRFGK